MAKGEEQSPMEGGSLTLGDSGYGTVARYQQAPWWFSGRRAALSIGALLAFCIFLALNSNSTRDSMPSALIAGFNPVKIAQPPAFVADSIGVAHKVDTSAAAMGGISSGDSNAAAVERSQARLDRSFSGGAKRSVEWVPVARTVYSKVPSFSDYVRSDDPTGDLDVNDLYKRSEDALINDINQKLKEKVNIEVERQVAEKVPKMQSAIIREQKMKQLVSDLTDQMQEVNHGFDQIQVLQAQGHEMFYKADATEADITSPETKDLFDRAEAILLSMNATVDCNGTNTSNATGCNSTNATDTGGAEAEGDEVAAAERAIRAESLKLREHKFVLSRLMAEEREKKNHQKDKGAIAAARMHVMGEAEKKLHEVHSPKAKANEEAVKKAAEHQLLLAREKEVREKKARAAKEGEAHAAAARHYKLVVEERMAKARKMKEEHMIKEQRVAKERKIMHERAVRAAEHGQHSTRGRASSVVEHPPAARKILKRLPEAEKKLDAKKVKALKKELKVAKARDLALLKTEKSKENEIRAEEHSVESRRAQFLKSLEAEGEQAKAFLSKAQHVTPIAEDAEKTVALTVAKDPHHSLVSKEQAIEKELKALADKAAFHPTHAARV